MSNTKEIKIESLRLRNEGFPTDVFNRIGKVILRKTAELYGIGEGDGYNLTLKKTDALPGSGNGNGDGNGDAYRITECPGGTLVEAVTVLGAISGAGRFLQENDFDGEKMILTHFTGTFIPKHEYLGVYFASHFGNYYVNAPEEEVIRYVEDLALWGVNLLRVWFDFHHYTGLGDPAAQPILKRLQLILKTAKSFGMKITFISLANEGYSTTPDAVRAEWAAQNGYRTEPRGHYHTEICPHKEGGLALILKNRLEMLDAFRDTPPDILDFWVYDQGGCTCAKCAPWGANGYIDTIKALIPGVKERFPQCRIGFCAWYLDLFTDGEWDGVYRAFGNDRLLQNEIGYIAAIYPQALPKDPVQAEAIRNGIGPGDKPLLGFPEISMQGCAPWGGFGANPYPAYLQNDWDVAGHAQIGMICYSEGIFDDVNKFTILGLHGGRFETALDAVRGYVRAELSKKHADEIVDLIRMLDETLPRFGQNREQNDPDAVRMVIARPEQIRPAAALARSIHAVLPERIRNGWRWQILYLRALADEALLDADFYIREPCEALLRKLEKLYHVGADSSWWVSPATRESFARTMSGA